jgi:hypothetical protein
MRNAERSARGRIERQIAESRSQVTPASHGYDEVGIDVVAPVRDTPRTTRTIEPAETNTPAQPHFDVPREYAELFGQTPTPVGGVDAVWQNGDGTWSSSDGTTYDPATGEGTYDPGEDSFATRTEVAGYDPNTGEMVSRVQYHRDPQRVRSSEALRVVEHDPKGHTRAWGAREAFDYYNNPNIDSIRDEALMHAAAAANEPVSGRYPSEALAYFGAIPPTAHLARASIRRVGQVQVPDNWDVQLTRKGIGSRWTDPNHRGNSVRVDLGDPYSPFPSQRVDHVIVQNNGRIIGRSGDPIEGSIKSNAVEAHIPLSEYMRWRSWDAP